MAIRAAGALGSLPDRLLDVGVALVLVGGLVVPLGMARALTGAPVLLNEVLIQHTGNDTTEFIELYGTAGHSLGGLSLVVVDGNNSTAGSVTLRVDFSGDQRLGGNGFFLLGNPDGLAVHYGVVPDVPLTTTAGSGFLPNASQTVALVETADLAGTSVTGGETAFDTLGITDPGSSETFFWGAPVLDLDDGFLPAGARRTVDGEDSDSPDDWTLADDHLGPANTPTPATPFDEPPTAACGPDLTLVAGSAASVPVSSTDPDGVVSAFALSVTPDPGTLTLGPATAAGAPGETAMTSVEVAATTPVGTYLVQVSAVTAASPPQQAACNFNLTVEPAPDPPGPPAPPTPSLSALLASFDELVAAGDVDGVKAGAVREHLERAAAFLQAGKHPAADAQLQAFANQLAGMSPKWATAGAVQALAPAVEALRSELSD